MLDPQPFRRGIRIAIIVRANGAPQIRDEMRPNRNGNSPGTWDELSVWHAIEMLPSFLHALTPAYTHARLSPRRLAKAAVDGDQKVPRAPHRDAAPMSFMRPANRRYRPCLCAARLGSNV
jgi:hypothetical protein